MERNAFGRLIGGVLGLSSLGALGALGVVFGGGPTPPLPGKSEGEWRLLDPVRYENLSIFPVVSANAYDTSWFLTLDEGLASGEVQVREQGSEGMARSRDGVVRPADSNAASVNQLVLINRSKRPLLLLAGELVSGGRARQGWRRPESLARFKTRRRQSLTRKFMSRAKCEAQWKHTWRKCGGGSLGKSLG